METLALEKLLEKSSFICWQNGLGIRNFHLLLVVN
jgi:hypothetical protein